MAEQQSVADGTVIAARGMVSSVDRLASDAGVAALRAGGSAVDFGATWITAAITDLLSSAVTQSAPDTAAFTPTVPVNGEGSYNGLPGLKLPTVPTEPDTEPSYQPWQLDNDSTSSSTTPTSSSTSTTPTTPTTSTSAATSTSPSAPTEETPASDDLDELGPGELAPSATPALTTAPSA